MEISVRVIDHDSQRYNTVGDWQFNGDGDLFVLVSCLNDWRKEMCIAVHEIAEALICKWQGVTQEEVDEFDMHLPQSYIGEPGDMRGCPYHFAHSVATGVERVIAVAFCLSWHDYEYTINNLEWHPKTATLG